MDRGEDGDAAAALRARTGDRRAFDELVQRHKEPLYRLARRYVGNADDAYDIVQNSFVAAWLALRRYDPSRSFSAWLRTILLNKCRDFSRRETVRRKVLGLFAREIAPAPQETETADADRKLAELDRAIARLPAFYKEPLLLVTVAGLSQAEAAVQLKTTAKAVEMRIRRAKQKIAALVARTDGIA